MNHVFKVGDIVQMTEECSGSMTGVNYTLEYRNHSNGDLWAKGCCCRHKWKLIQNAPESNGVPTTEVRTEGENVKTKRVYDVMVINKNTDEILVNEQIIDGCSSNVQVLVGVKYASKFKGIDMSDLYVRVTEIANYEAPETKSKE